MIDEIKTVIRKHRRFFISTHIRPDGDALGSEVALATVLKKLGKEVTVINSDPAPMNMDWLPGMEHVHVFDGSIEQRERIDGAEVIFVLDTNSLERLGKLVPPVRNARGLKVLIDHHTHPENWFDLIYARESASSTGELIFEIAMAIDPDLIDDVVATALYAAIMTDTGSFRYNTVTPEVHRIVADLLERGDLSPAPIHIAVYDTRTTESLRLLGRVLDSLTLLYGGKVAFTVITPRMLRETGAASDDTEGFVNYALSIEGVDAAVQFFETESGTKASFRSKGDVFVNDWARAFGGGGHKNAAGAFLNAPLDEAIEQVMAAAPRYVSTINVEDEEVSLTEEDASYLSELVELRSHQK